MLNNLRLSVDENGLATNRRWANQGLRILSAYNVPLGNGETARLWVITAADRSVTTLLLPEEY